MNIAIFLFILRNFTQKNSFYIYILIVLEKGRSQNLSQSLFLLKIYILIVFNRIKSEVKNVGKI